MLEAKPNVLNSSDAIMFMFFWKERRCLPNYAELRIIMVHKDKNGKSNWGRTCRHHRQTYLRAICTFFLLIFETLWKLKVRHRRGKCDASQSQVERWILTDLSLRGQSFDSVVIVLFSNSFYIPFILLLDSVG